MHSTKFTALPTSLFSTQWFPDKYKLRLPNSYCAVCLCWLGAGRKGSKFWWTFKSRWSVKPTPQVIGRALIPPLQQVHGLRTFVQLIFFFYRHFPLFINSFHRHQDHDHVHVHKDMNVTIKFHWPGLKTEEEGYNWNMLSRMYHSRSRPQHCQADRPKATRSFFIEGSRGCGRGATNDHRSSKRETWGTSPARRQTPNPAVLPLLSSERRLRKTLPIGQGVSRTSRENQEVHPPA